MKIKKMQCQCGCKGVLAESRSDCDGCNYNECYHADTCDRDNRESCSKIPGCDTTCAFYESLSYEDGQCKVGKSLGAGCWLLTCPDCGKAVENLPFSNI